MPRLCLNVIYILIKQVGRPDVPRRGYPALIPDAYGSVGLRAAGCTPGESPVGYPRRAALGAPARPPPRLRRRGNTEPRKGRLSTTEDPRCIFATVLASPARNMAGRAVVLRIEPPAASRP